MQAKDLIVLGSSRLLGKLYCGDLSVSGSTNFLGNLTVEGSLDVGANTSSNAIIKLNGKEAIRGTDGWLRINEPKAFASGIYFGSNLVRTDGTLRVGSAATTFNITTSAATIGVPTTINQTLTVNNTLTTTNLKTATITNSGNIYNLYGTVETDTIKSNKWDIVSTQNLGGNFYVCPTIIVTEGSTVIISSVNGTTIVGTLNDETNITSNSFAGHTWTSGSKIKITGKLTSGTTSYVLGTCDGTLTANMNTTANTINFSVQCNASIVPPAGTYTISGGTVMMYNVSGSNPVGIHMTSYGTNKYTYIDIYNGSNGTTPKARLGKLDGLAAVGNKVPQGYGIYTDNGYFKGEIVADTGYIGGTNGWAILSQQLSSAGKNMGANDSMYLATKNLSSATPIGGRTGTDWRFTIGPNFGVTNTGAFYATAGSISGSIVASGISADNITTGHLDADLIEAHGITANQIKAGTITATEIASKTITSEQIAANAITVGNINPKVYSYNNSGRGTGYAKLFTIAHTQSYKNSPISFVFHNRGKKETRVTFNYLNNGTATSAVVQNATYDGGTPFYYVSKGNAVYDVYFALAESYDTIYISDYINPYSEVGLEVTWNGEYYGTSLPDGAVEFTKLAGSRNSTDIDTAATTATSYITNIDSNNGITIKPLNKTGNNYLQINSSAISFYRDGVETTKIENSAYRIGKLGTNMRNVYVTDSAVQIRNNTTVLAEYGSSTKFYLPGAATATTAIEINSSGINIPNGFIKLGSLTSVTDTTSGHAGVYIASNGTAKIGNSSTSYLQFNDGNLTITTPKFSVASDGTASASNAIIDGYIGATQGYIGTQGAGWQISGNSLNGYSSNPSIELYSTSTSTTKVASLNSNGIFGKNLLAGTIRSPKITKGKSKTFTVRFANFTSTGQTPFSFVPIVVACARSAAPWNCVVGVHDITTEKFSCTIKNESSTSQSRIINFIAYGFDAAWYDYEFNEDGSSGTVNTDGADDSVTVTFDGIDGAVISSSMNDDKVTPLEISLTPLINSSGNNYTPIVYDTDTYLFASAYSSVPGTTVKGVSTYPDLTNSVTTAYVEAYRTNTTFTYFHWLGFDSTFLSSAVGPYFAFKKIQITTTSSSSIGSATFAYGKTFANKPIVITTPISNTPQSTISSAQTQDGLTTSQALIYEYRSSAGSNYVACMAIDITALASSSYSSYIKGGQVVITPTKANTPKYATVSFASAFENPPLVVCSIAGQVPGSTVKGCSVTAVTETSCRIWTTRTNTTNTVINWIAVDIASILKKDVDSSTDTVDEEASE